MTTFIRTTLAAAIASSAVLTFSSSPASAQGTDARWRAWTGCWRPVSAQGPLPSRGDVCVVPASGRSAVDVLVVNGKTVATRTHIEADGVAHSVSRDGCTGTEKATWSATGTRVYLRAAMTCDGGITRNDVGVMSIDPRYEWLDVRGVSTGTNAGVAVARYEAVLDTAGLPAEVMPAFAARGPAANNAILAASAPLTLNDIVDVSAMTDSGVTATWLVERNRDVKIDLDGKQLTKLADEGVAPSVIDVLVALSHPAVFALNANSDDVAYREQAPRGRTSAETMRDLGGYRYGRYGMYDPWGWDYGYGYSSLFYSPYSLYSPYSPYYNPYYGGYGYYPGSQPIIIVTRSDGGGTDGGSGSAPPHGRVVKGRGYTGGSSSGSSGSSRAGSSGASASSSPASTSGSSSGSSSSGSSSAGRTAVRKPPI